jgi:hypothetical protein
MSFARTPSDQLAASNGIEIEFIRKPDVRKEDRVPHSYASCEDCAQSERLFRQRGSA